MPAHNTKTIYLANRIPNSLCVTELMWMCLLLLMLCVHTITPSTHFIHILAMLYAHKRNWRVFWFLSIQFTCSAAYLMHAIDENTSAFLLNLDLFVDLFIYELLAFVCVRAYDAMCEWIKIKYKMCLFGVWSSCFVCISAHRAHALSAFLCS